MNKIWIAFLAACGGQMSEETVKATVEAAFQEANQTGGRLGWELAGKGQWFNGLEFDKTCLMENDLAYPNHMKQGRISPTYAAQSFVTASTKRGYCLDLGTDLSLEVLSIEPVSEMSQGWDIQNVQVRFSIKNPTPWFPCLKESHLSRMVQNPEKQIINGFSRHKILKNLTQGSH